MIVVVLSPHRDDAAFSLGLSVDAWIAAGHTVSVLNCFTQSAYAPYSADVDLVHENDRVSFVSALRRREDIAWSKLTRNRLTFHDLDLLDAPLRLACDVDEVLTVEIRPGDRAVARIEGAIAKLMRKATQGSLAIAAPLGVGGHIDHRVVHQAILQATAGGDLPVAFYEDLPYATRPGGAEQLEAAIRSTGGNLQASFAAPPPADPISAQARKSRIAECYDSQVDSDVIRAMASFTDAYSTRERLWASPAWLATGLCSAAEVGV